MAKGDSSGAGATALRNNPGLGPMLGGGVSGISSMMRGNTGAPPNPNTPPVMNPNMDFLQQLFGGMGKFMQGNPGAPPPNTGGFRAPEWNQPNIGPYPMPSGGSFAPMPPGSYPNPMGKGSNHPSSSSWRNSPWAQAPPIQTMWPQFDPTQGGDLVNNGWGKMVPRAQMEELYRRGAMT